MICKEIAIKPPFLRNSKKSPTVVKIKLQTQEIFINIEDKRFVL